MVGKRLEELMEFAERQFRLSLETIGGVSTRAHMEAVRRQTGKEEPDVDECPDVLSYVWAWWHELHCGAKETGIDYSQVLAWSILHAVTLSHFDISAIMRVDRLFLTIVAEQQKHG